MYSLLSTRCTPPHLSFTLQYKLHHNDLSITAAYHMYYLSQYLFISLFYLSFTLHIVLW